jgi:hypothetical protein
MRRTDRGGESADGDAESGVCEGVWTDFGRGEADLKGEQANFKAESIDLDALQAGANTE